MNKQDNTMISIKIKSLMRFAELLGKNEQILYFKENSSVADIIESLKDRYGDEFSRLLNHYNKENFRIKFCLNGRDTDFLNGMDTICQDGDELLLWIPLGGG